MKKSLFLTILALCALPALGADKTELNFDVNAGTQGAGVSLGYKLTPSVRLRLRGAMLSYEQNENWSDSQGQLKLYGDNVGLLVDIFPGEGNFYITAGLNFSENKMRCHSRIDRKPGMVGTATVGGIEYSIIEGTHAKINGKYSWNHAQPYIGIGYQDALFDSSTFYYSLDLGINFMGSGNLTVSGSDNLRFRDPATNEMKPATEAVMEESIRKEGRDFFKIADDLSVYPVIQFSIGARF